MISAVNILAWVLGQNDSNVSPDTPNEMRTVYQTGSTRARPYTSYAERVKELERTGKIEEAVALLVELLPVLERESSAKGRAPSPWYYERLAHLYCLQGRYFEELEVLKRYRRAALTAPNAFEQEIGEASYRLATARS